MAAGFEDNDEDQDDYESQVEAKTTTNFQVV